MWVNISIGAAGIVVSVIMSVVMYKLGKRSEKKQDEQHAQDDRFQRVFDLYIDAIRKHNTGGLDGLQRAGVATLDSNTEIRRLIELICKHSEKNPLGGNPGLFDDTDLKRFFEFTAENDINFMTTRIEKVIERFRGQS